MGKSKTETTSKQQGTSSTSPVLSPEARALNTLMMNYLQDRFAGPALPAGYETSGIAGINQSYNLGQQGVMNRLTAQGLGGSPISAGVQSNYEMGRLGDIGSFRAQIPLLEQEQRNRDFLQALSLFGSQPVGQTGTYNQSGQQTTVQSMSPLQMALGIAGLGASIFGGGFGAMGGGGLFGGGAPGSGGMAGTFGTYTNPYSVPGMNSQVPGGYTSPFPTYRL